MKKKILSVLAVLAAGFIALTSCQEEKPYSFYQIGPNFIGIEILSPEQIEALPDSEKDKYAVMNYLTGWLINQDFVQTGMLGKPIIIEGADEAENDRQASVIYDNKVSDLQKENLEKVLETAQTATGNNESELVISTSGQITFSYDLTKGSNGPSTIRSTLFTVDYAPLSTPSEPQEPEL